MARGEKGEDRTVNHRILIVMLAAASREPSFRLTLPHWQKFEQPILLATPWDQPVAADLPMIWIGPGGYAGPSSVDRWRNLLPILALMSRAYDGFALVEYDSVCLLDELPMPVGLRGIEGHGSCEGFFAPRYLVPPWTVDSESLVRIARESKLTTNPRFEGGWDDRMLAAWATFAGVPILAYDHPGYHWEPGDGEGKLAQAVLSGVKWIHNIKSARTLEVVLDALKTRRASEPKENGQDGCGI